MKTIPGFSKYAACEAGYIWRIVPTDKTRVVPYRLRAWLSRTKHAYLNVKLQSDGVRRQVDFRVNRLVALTYHGEPPEGFEASHENGDKLDNRPSNLVWKSHLENIRDRHKHGTTPRGATHPMTKLTAAQIAEIRERLKSESESEN